MSIRVFVLLLLVGAASGAVPAAAEARAPRVLVLANRDDAESLELARHYVERRGLAESDIVALPMPLTEQITWPEFVATIWNPLLAAAIERGGIDAIAMSLQDELGRTKIVPSGHALDALVVCRGVPLRIAHDPALYDERSNPLTANPALRSNEGAVDSELALLATGNPPIAALVPNPLHAADPARSAEALRQVIPVGRLDGPTLEQAKGLVDRALQAERDGVAGRAYIDLGGPHRQGDEWLEACVKPLAELGFETEVDKERATLGPTLRFDAPVFYFGWYAGDLDGPFARPDFVFPPGAVALHIHSFSATTLRSPTRGWTGPLVAKGVTATFGNVGEPYLQFTHQPQVLLAALARGEPMGVAALRAVNALSWKSILVGDPLYRPFAVSSEVQWARRTSLDPRTETYARIRRMRLLAGAGRGEEALQTGVRGMRENPSLPLALTLAGMQLSAGDAAAAKRSLGIFGALPNWRPADRGLVTSAARMWQAAGEAAEGVKLIQRLLDEAALSRDERLAALRQGTELARAALDFGRMGSWEAEYARLTAPPPPPPSAAKPAAGK